MTKLQLSDVSVFDTVAKNPELLHRVRVEHLDACALSRTCCKETAILIQTQVRNWFRMACNFTLLSLVVEHDNLDAVLGILRENGQDKSFSRRIQCNLARWIVRCRQCVQKFQISQSVYMHFVAHNHHNFV